MSILIAAFVSLVFILLVWAAVMAFDNASIVDVCWSLGILLNTTVYFFYFKPSWQGVLVYGLITVWALRLSSMLLFTRVLTKHVDTRYKKLSDSWTNKTLGFLQNFLFQALLFWLLSLTCYSLFAYSLPINQKIFTLLFVVAITSLCLESLADYQLSEFKKNPAGSVCNVGLWQYSRHPNYFFDWLFWACISLIALVSSLHWLSLSAVICLYVIMQYFTIPISERTSIESRGEAYLAYQEQTSTFFPWKSN